MTILPEPAHFKRQEYNKFLQDYPHAKMVLASSFINEEGEEIPLVREIGDEVHVYVGLLSDEQKTNLGNAALKELHKHLSKAITKARFATIFGVGIVVVIILVGLIWWTVKKSGNGPGNGEDPTPTPAQVPMATPTSPPKPTATPRKSTPTPVYKLPTPTPTPKPTPMPTAILTPQISQVKLKDENGALIPAINGVYSLRPHETVTIWPELNSPSNLSVMIEYAPALGTMNANTYIAPDRSGIRDMITLKVLDSESGKKMFDTFITIKIIATQ